MKYLINVIITAAIIAGAAFLFPEYVVCADARTLVLAIIVMLIAGLIIALIMITVMILEMAIIKNRAVELITEIILIVPAGLIELMAANHFVTGFEVKGILTYIILAVMLSFVGVQNTSK